jgi:hypothetical protein
MTLAAKMLIKRGLNPFGHPPIPKGATVRTIKARHPEYTKLAGSHVPRMTNGDLTLWADK